MSKTDETVEDWIGWNFHDEERWVGDSDDNAYAVTNETLNDEISDTVTEYASLMVDHEDESTYKHKAVPFISGISNQETAWRGSSDEKMLSSLLYQNSEDSVDDYAQQDSIDVVGKRRPFPVNDLLIAPSVDGIDFDQTTIDGNRPTTDARKRPRLEGNLGADQESLLHPSWGTARGYNCFYRHEGTENLANAVGTTASDQFIRKTTTKRVHDYRKPRFASHPKMVDIDSSNPMVTVSPALPQTDRHQAIPDWLLHAYKLGFCDSRSIDGVNSKHGRGRLHRLCQSLSKSLSDQDKEGALLLNVAQNVAHLYGWICSKMDALERLPACNIDDVESAKVVDLLQHSNSLDVSMLPVCHGPAVPSQRSSLSGNLANGRQSSEQGNPEQLSEAPRCPNSPVASHSSLPSKAMLAKTSEPLSHHLVSYPRQRIDVYGTTSSLAPCLLPVCSKNGSDAKQDPSARVGVTYQEQHIPSSKCNIVRRTEPADPASAVTERIQRSLPIPIFNVGDMNAVLDDFSSSPNIDSQTFTNGPPVWHQGNEIDLALQPRVVHNTSAVSDLVTEIDQELFPTSLNEANYTCVTGNMIPEEKTPASKHRATSYDTVGQLPFPDGDVNASSSADESDLHCGESLDGDVVVVPSKVDVLLGKRGVMSHPGNVAFRKEGGRLAEQYIQHPTTVRKEAAATDLLCYVYNQGGRFLENKNGFWGLASYEISFKKAKQLMTDAKKKHDRTVAANR